MGAWLLLAFSLLFTKGFSAREAPQSSCHTKLNEDHHQRQANGSTIHLTLHHPRSPCSPAPLPDLPFSEVLHHDEFRAHMLSSRITKSHPPLASSSVSVPLSRGTTVGVGNYVTKIGLGTPSVDYVMVVDTGSSLSWLQCSPCKISCHAQVGAIFDPTKSATYKAVQCSAAECGGLQSATLNPSACTASNVCVYEASYGDSSFSVGFLGKDTLSLGSLAGKGAPVLPGFVYGCGQDNEGLFGKAAGLIGLAKNKLSLLSQLSPKLGSSFTYCLPTTASAGYLSIGPYDPTKLVFVSNPIWDSPPPSLGFLDPMARKRKSEATGLDEVDRTMYSTFCTGANSLSQLYTQAMNQQKLSFQAGERHALEKLYQWILRQHEEGSRVTAADIVTHIQNEIDYGEDASMSPRLQSQYPHPQTAMHFTNPSASYGQATAGTTPRGAPSDQVKNSVFSNALSSPVRRSLQPYQLAQGGGCYPNGGQGGRNHDANSPAHNRANSPGSNDSSMDMHSDSPPHES